MTALPRLAFIGAGRLTSALAPALARAGYPVTIWRRPSPAAAREAKTSSPARPEGESQLAHASLLLPPGESWGQGKTSSPADPARAPQPALPSLPLPPGEGEISFSTSPAAPPQADQQSPQPVIDQADLVFLAVPDAAIAPVANSLRWRRGNAAIHCSGASGLELLDAARAQGAAVGAFHPLQTLPGGETNLEGITIAVEASTPELACVLTGMAQALGARPLTLPGGARPLYHASAALASNYLVTLISEAATLWQAFGLTREDGLHALLPLVQQTVANLKNLTPEEALTGPIARGDADTVRKHLQALPDDTKTLYRQLGLATIPLAQRKGTLRGQAAQRMATTLQGDD